MGEGVGDAASFGLALSINSGAQSHASNFDEVTCKPRPNAATAFTTVLSRPALPNMFAEFLVNAGKCW